MKPVACSLKIEVLVRGEWKLVGHSRTEANALKAAKQALHAMPSATEYRITAV